MNIVNIFKIHYFLYWGSISGVLNYSLLIITEHGGVKQDDTGILYGILPLALMFAKPVFCSMADKFTIHEWVLVSSIISQTVFYGLLSIIPFLSEKFIWPLFCLFIFLGSTATGVQTSITDSMVMKVAETENSNFGKMRVWGTIGWGLISFGVGELNKLDSKIIPLYIPGILLFIVLQLFDLLLVLCYLGRIQNACQKSVLNRERRPTLQETIEQSINNQMSQSMDHNPNLIQSINQIENHSMENSSTDYLKKKTEDDTQSKIEERKKNKQITKFLFLTCKNHPMLIKYIFICIITGLCTALNWIYYPYFLNELRKNDTRLVGYTQVVQCFASEMPMMYFSGYIIKQIGARASFSIVLFTFSARYFSYTLFTKSNAYYILIVEITHGITFGLFYYVMNILAREYSKKMYRVEFDYYVNKYYSQNDLIAENGDKIKFEELKKSIKLPEHDDSTFATMQGIMSGAYEGFGVALGSFIGGYFIQNKGMKFTWYLFSLIAFVVFLADIILTTIIYLKNILIKNN